MQYCSINTRRVARQLAFVRRLRVPSPDPPVYYSCVRAHACSVAVLAHARARAWLPQPGLGICRSSLEKKGGTRKANEGPSARHCLRPCNQQSGQQPEIICYQLGSKVRHAWFLWCFRFAFSQTNFAIHDILIYWNYVTENYWAATVLVFQIRIDILQCNEDFL